MVPHNVNCNKVYRSTVNWMYVKQSGETKVPTSESLRSTNMLELTCKGDWRGRKTNEFNEKEPANVGKQGVLTSAKNIALGIDAQNNTSCQFFIFLPEDTLSNDINHQWKHTIECVLVHCITTRYTSCFGSWQMIKMEGGKKEITGCPGGYLAQGASVEPVRCPLLHQTHKPKHLKTAPCEIF